MNFYPVKKKNLDFFAIAWYALNGPERKKLALFGLKRARTEYYGQKKRWSAMRPNIFIIAHFCAKVVVEIFSQNL